MRVYDVTVPITPLMPVWPGHPRVRIDRVSSIAQGGRTDQSNLALSLHTGTHVDAPCHLSDNGLTVDQLPLELLTGPAFVAEVDRPEGKAIQVYDLASLYFPKNTTRLLLKTSNSYFWEDRLNEFERDYVYLAPKTAEWLVKRGIRVVGIDYLSVESIDSRDFLVHQTLHGAGVVIVEGLNLSRIPAGPCQMICLPLKITGGDGAPARVLLMRN